MVESKFRKILVISKLDQEWGFIVSNLGFNSYPKNSDYPLKGPPGKYMFSWETGRILDEYHLVLISKGKGVFESKSAGKRKINEGDAFLLIPGEWHRYSPLKKTGWTEYWVGFSGEIADIIMKKHFFKKENPLVRKINNQLIVSLFQKLIHLIKDEPFGFQRIASGICIQLLAEFCNSQLGSGLLEKSPISNAKYIMNEKIGEEIDLKKVAKDLGMSYSKFRSDFKRQTGLSPLQYFLLLKIEKAKSLLLITNSDSKMIAYDLGFESEFYFCRLFKMKVGLTPKQFRKNKGLSTS